MAEKNFFMGLIVAFMVIIVGASLMSTASDTVAETTDTMTISAETFALVNGTPVAINASGTTLVSVTAVETGATTLTETTHYDVDTSAGTVNLTGVTYDTGNYNVSYTYRDNNYISDATSRSITDLIIVFFAVAVMAVAIGAAYRKDMFNF